MRSQILHLIAGTAATLLLVGGSTLLGPAALFLNLFAPTPAALVVMRSGVVPGSLVVIASSVILWGWAGGTGALAYLLQFGLGSLALPLLLRRGVAWDRAVFGALAVIALAAGLTLATLVATSEVGLTELVDTYVKSEVDKATALYQGEDLPADQREEMQALIKQVADLLTRAWPGLVVIFCGAMLLLTVQWLAVFSRGRYLIGGLPFPMWKAPEWLVWLLIAAGFGVFFATGAAATVALNLLVMLLPLYFMQGMAIISYYFTIRGISPLLRTLGYALVMLLNPLPLIVTALGVFDLWADFRKPRVKNT